MTDLLFMNPVFHDGINVTVRNGLKWDGLVTSLPFPVFVKRTGDDHVVSLANIVGKIVLQAKHIPPSILGLEHDGACHNPDGLEEAMKFAYGEEWSAEEKVTVLFFVITAGPLDKKHLEDLHRA
jgi:hypothetical protein